MEGGTTFCPTTHKDKEIIECLHSLITGCEHHSGISYITFANVYSAAPDDLVAQHAQPASSGTGDGGHGGPYYFLSSVHGVSETSKRKSRAVNCTDGKQGRWHTEAGRKPVEGTADGYRSNFSYEEKTASGTTRRPGWLMVEYSIAGYDNVVIAKIYRSPRHQATNVPPSYMASSSAADTKMLQEIERKLMSDDAGGGAVDHVESLQAELANYICFPNHDNGNHGALQYPIAGQYVSGAAAAAHGAPQFLDGQYNVSGASQASAAHYLTAAAAAALQVSPGHADHANKVVLGHNQTVCSVPGTRCRGKSHNTSSQNPLSSLASRGSSPTSRRSTSGGLAIANLDFDDDFHAW